MSIPIRDTFIYQAMLLTWSLPWGRLTDRGIDDVTDGMKRAALNSLLSWAENHAPHPDFPEYEGKSYLPEYAPFEATDPVAVRRAKLEAVGVQFRDEVFMAPEPEEENE
jgi:hypothetical protein